MDIELDINNCNMDNQFQLLVHILAFSTTNFPMQLNQAERPEFPQEAGCSLTGMSCQVLHFNIF